MFLDITCAYYLHHMKIETLIPMQHTGAASNTAYSIELRNSAEAHKVFLHARENLLDINKWHDLSGPGTAYFQLTDKNGNEAERMVMPGDYIRINIPGPSNAKTHFDWVIVEKVEEQVKHTYHVWTSITVRPAPSPIDQQKGTAHFFSEEATSSFIVERKGVFVKACVLGRNEKVNEHSQNWLDTMRNTIVAFSAMLGFNKPQWKSLVKGILRDSTQHELPGRRIA